MACAGLRQLPRRCRGHLGTQRLGGRHDRPWPDEQVIRTVFGRWHIEHMTRATVPSDTRTLELLVVRLST